MRKIATVCSRGVGASPKGPGTRPGQHVSKGTQMNRKGGRFIQHLQHLRLTPVPATKRAKVRSCFNDGRSEVAYPLRSERPRICASGHVSLTRVYVPHSHAATRAAAANEPRRVSFGDIFDSSMKADAAKQKHWGNLLLRLGRLSRRQPAGPRKRPSTGGAAASSRLGFAPSACPKGGTIIEQSAMIWVG
jgi:hypothetical protein